MRRVILSALFTAIAAIGVYAADNDNASSLPGEKGAAPSGTASYFEGVWVGAWPGWLDASASQDVTIKIERGGKEGVFRVEYSWGASRMRRGTVPAGSVKAKGREEGDRFVFQWANKRGNDVEITLRKHNDDMVKATIEKSGPLGPADRPTNETVLKRK